MEVRNRNFGLDVLRALAIIGVLFNHVANYFIIFPRSTLLGDIAGSFGVELFFILSGFLIGRIVLTSLAVNMSLPSVKKFYLRRWFRTLPLYYFLLICFIILAAVTTGVINFYPLHFVFLQNFSQEALRFFSVSWSLAIEEWFYLLLPLMLFVGYKSKFFTKRMVTFLFVLVIGIIFVRMIYVLQFNPTFDEMRKHVFLRFDSLLIGVLLAGCKLYAHALYRYFQRPAICIAAVGVVCLLAIGYAFLWNRHLLDASFIARVFGFPLLSIAFVLMVPFAETSKFINHTLHKIGIVKWVITWTSILSYSIYLIHLTIFDQVRVYFPDQAQPYISIPLVLIVTFFVSYLLYSGIEKPFLRLREKVAGRKKES